jgi:hypothetical protein
LGFGRSGGGVDRGGGVVQGCGGNPIRNFLTGKVKQDFADRNRRAGSGQRVHHKLAKCNKNHTPQYGPSRGGLLNNMIG